MESGREKSMKLRKRPRKGRKIHLKKLETVYNNPWPYTETVAILPENLKLDRTDLTSLECKDHFEIGEIPAFIDESE